MGVYTNIRFLNENDPEFIKAKNGTDEERQEWEDDNGGSIEDIPGAIMWDTEVPKRDTEDEYGGFVVRVSDIPKDATHIYVWRG